MSISRDKERGCWVFEFDRVISGQGRIRSRKRLPKGWSRAQADAFDRQETSRLYAVATGASKLPAGIEDAVAIYIKERVPELKQGKRITQELALIYWAYKGKTLAQLPDVCTKIREFWAGDLAPATIRNRIRYLCSACRWAWKRHGLCDNDPAGRVITPSVNNERQVYTNREGMLRIAVATQCRVTRALIRVAFYSGMRLGEIYAAKVNTDRWLFELLDTKNGDPRFVPIHPKIRRCVLRHMPWIWSRDVLSRRWRKARDAVGMSHMRLHDLRHSAASEMLASGVDLYTIGKVLGHKTPISTKRYAHMSTDSMAQAMHKIGKKRG